MVHKLSGLIAGVLAAVALIMIFEALGHRLFPPAAGSDVYAPTAPGGATGAASLAVVAGWFSGVLTGSWLAVRISREQWTGWAVAGLFLLASIYNFSLVRHPTWMIVAGLAAILVAGGLGPFLAERSARRI